MKGAPCPTGSERCFLPLRKRWANRQAGHTQRASPPGQGPCREVLGAFSMFSLLLVSPLLRIIFFSAGPCWEGGQREWCREAAKVATSTKEAELAPGGERPPPRQDRVDSGLSMSGCPGEPSLAGRLSQGSMAWPPPLLMPSNRISGPSSALPPPLCPSVAVLTAHFCDCLLHAFPQETEHSWRQETCHILSSQQSSQQSQSASVPQGGKEGMNGAEARDGICRARGGGGGGGALSGTPALALCTWHLTVTSSVLFSPFYFILRPLTQHCTMHIHTYGHVAGYTHTDLPGTPDQQSYNTITMGVAQ